MSDPCKYSGNKVLLVEGKNDCHVVLALCKEHDVPETFGVYECKNNAGVLKRLNAMIQQPDTPEAIGIVLDVDEGLISSRWQQIQDKLKYYGYAFPERPLAEGTILPLNGDTPKLGIWLMPNNQNPGMLEDFLISLANADAITFAAESVSYAKERGHTTFKDVHLSKAILYTYLSWQDEPGKPLGQSITSHVLNPQTGIAHTFTSWLRRLFC